MGRAGGKARPHGGAVLPGDFGADHGAACAGSTAQVAQLERTAGENCAGDAIILFNDNCVLGHIFKYSERDV